MSARESDVLNSNIDEGVDVMLQGVEASPAAPEEGKRPGGGMLDGEGNLNPDWRRIPSPDKPGLRSMRKAIKKVQGKATRDSWARAREEEESIHEAEEAKLCARHLLPITHAAFDTLLNTPPTPNSNPETRRERYEWGTASDP